MRSNMKKSIASSAGFTLIEVLIVITLIVVLASMGMASYHEQRAAQPRGGVA